MYAKEMQSQNVGKKMMTIFYDNDKIPIKKIHFDAQSYDDYTVAPSR